LRPTFGSILQTGAMTANHFLRTNKKVDN
jgi:hypothetical protein